uniref:Alkyl transferase n=1 Tax=Rhodosorus marinus TaxID=101924 RepID=A0A7S0BQ02_9RHOD|mmetsp:Transcript_4015/g.5706  ORF Transcript_4015/g.5706 Transcript_4015/m.5706 type:complete len:321 (+) Transcript_4015:145-1107(+)
MFVEWTFGLLVVVVLVVLSRGRPLRKLVLAALRYSGDCPKHVAVIMDGNRRWAKRRSMALRDGHTRGGQTMIEFLKWHREADISTITVYAFSIENFKRPKDEVDYIMDLAIQNVEDMLQPGSAVHKERLRVRFWGEMDMVPRTLRVLAAKLTCVTSKYEGASLNMCFAYTSRVEIARAIATVTNAISDGIVPYEVNEELLSEFLESGTCRGGLKSDGWPDVIIRTSGETRLSDFLLWQSAFSHLAFLRVMWPDFNAFHYSRVVLSYRRAKADMDKRAARYQEYMSRKHRSQSLPHETKEALYNIRHMYANNLLATAAGSC